MLDLRACIIIKTMLHHRACTVAHATHLVTLKQTGSRASELTITTGASQCTNYTQINNV